MPSLGQERVADRRYVLIKRLTAEGTEAYQVYDEHAGLQGAFGALYFLPTGRATEQRLRVLDRLGQRGEHFPRVVAFERRRDSIRVVFEWIEGEDLLSFLTLVRQGRQAPMSATEASKRIGRLAHGVSHLATIAKSVHGDIKPGNLVLTPRPHRLVLIDFGSAWPVERTLKREPSDGITAPYAAPEQLEGNGFVDWRADVFGLTVVWYELMTLQIPYDGMGGRAGLAEYRDDFAKTFIPPSHLSPNAEQIPASVWRLIDDAVERGLALRADDRFADRGSWLKAMNGIQNAIHDPPSISSWDRRWLAWLDWFSLPKKK
jgi:serine/threonine protein kinase